MELLHKVYGILSSIGDFFVLMWNDEERWWCIGGFIVLLIILYKIGIIQLVILPFKLLFKGISYFRGGKPIHSNTTYKTNYGIHSKSPINSNNMKVIIKGVDQMNGPKPFKREIAISPSESGYYSQLMGNKHKQAQWIIANFPGADINRGFSLTINIK